MAQELESAARPQSSSRLVNLLRAIPYNILEFLKYSLPMALLGLKFLEWWYQSQFARRGGGVGKLPVPPPPEPVDVRTISLSRFGLPQSSSMLTSISPFSLARSNAPPAPAITTNLPHLPQHTDQPRRPTQRIHFLLPVCVQSRRAKGTVSRDGLGLYDGAD